MKVKTDLKLKKDEEAVAEAEKANAEETIVQSCSVPPCLVDFQAREITSHRSKSDLALSFSSIFSDSGGTA